MRDGWLGSGLLTRFRFCYGWEMRIVVLDGHTLNPGDLDWARLAQLGELEVHERSPGPTVLDRASEAEILLTNKTRLDRATIEALPNLRYIGVLATGHDVVDTQTCRDRGIVVTNVPEYGTRTVAQHVFALILELCNRVGLHSRDVADGGWTKREWSYCLEPMRELDGKTLGIVGYGRIGAAVGAIGSALGMKILAHARTPKDGVECVGLDTLFTRSDVISLHCPLTPDTEKMINAEALRKIRTGAFLINTARGQLVNEHDLAAALTSGPIAAAALDVLSQEPPPDDHPLIGLPNCLITPHNAWAAPEARARLLAIGIDNLKAFLDGQTQNAVS